MTGRSRATTYGTGPRGRREGATTTAQRAIECCTDPPRQVQPGIGGPRLPARVLRLPRLHRQQWHPSTPPRSSSAAYRLARLLRFSHSERLALTMRCSLRLRLAHQGRSTHSSRLARYRRSPSPQRLAPRVRSPSRSRLAHHTRCSLATRLAHILRSTRTRRLARTHVSAPSCASARSALFGPLAQYGCPAPRHGRYSRYLDDATRNQPTSLPHTPQTVPQPRDRRRSRGCAQAAGSTAEGGATDRTGTGGGTDGAERAGGTDAPASSLVASPLSQALTFPPGAAARHASSSPGANRTSSRSLLDALMPPSVPRVRTGPPFVRTPPYAQGTVGTRIRAQWNPTYWKHRRGGEGLTSTFPIL